jgi:hypothetical protein
MAHSENEILVAGSFNSNSNNLPNAVIKFYPHNGTWSELYKSPNYNKIFGLFQLGQKIFVKHQFSESIYQFDPSTNKFNDTGLRTKMTNWILSLAVPAKVFSNLPGGCEGVE